MNKIDRNVIGVTSGVDSGVSKSEADSIRPSTINVFTIMWKQASGDITGAKLTLHGSTNTTDWYKTEFDSGILANAESGIWWIAPPHQVLRSGPGRTVDRYQVPQSSRSAPNTGLP